MAQNVNVHHDRAPDPVECPQSPNGKHAPRTVENVDSNGQHTKTSVCHYCNQVA